MSCVDCHEALPWGDAGRRVGERGPLCAGCAARRDPWGITLWVMFDMAADSDLFVTAPELEAMGGVRDENRYVVPAHPDELHVETAPGVWEGAVALVDVRGVGSIRARPTPAGGLELDVRDPRGEPAPHLAAAVRAALDGWARAAVRRAHQDDVTVLPLFGDVG